MANRSQRETVDKLVRQLAKQTGRPEEWWNGGSANKGALYADHNSVYGGWVLHEAHNEGGAVNMGILGFPRERLPLKSFVYLLHMAIQLTDKEGH